MDGTNQETGLAEAQQLPRAQRERLAYIDFRLYFLGELRRTDVAERFETGLAGATRDIALYKRLAPHNCELAADKVYRPLPSFSPLFEHSPQRVLTALSQGFGEGLDDSDFQPSVLCEIPSSLTLPNVSLVAPITRAIKGKKAIKLGYTSVESGRTERELVPLALVDNGLRWHVRAFDRRRQEFRDFVFTRMENPVVLDNSPVRKEETAEYDMQWTRIIQLDLVPHPNHPRPEIVKMDYGMKDGVLRVKVRAANAGYMLRRWSVDCSPNHHLKNIESALWLSDPLALYGANSAKMAPGYQDPHSSEPIKAM